MVEGEDERIQGDVSDRLAAELPAQAAADPGQRHGWRSHAGRNGGYLGSPAPGRGLSPGASRAWLRSSTICGCASRAGRVRPDDGASRYRRFAEQCSNRAWSPPVRPNQMLISASAHEDQEAVDHHQERRRDPRHVGDGAEAVRGTPGARSPRKADGPSPVLGAWTGAFLVRQSLNAARLPVPSPRARRARLRGRRPG